MPVVSLHVSDHRLPSNRDLEKELCRGLTRPATAGKMASVRRLTRLVSNPAIEYWVTGLQGTKKVSNKHITSRLRSRAKAFSCEI